MLKRNKGMSTARKPLVDISNGEKSSRVSKKKAPGDGGDGSGSGALDLLLLVRSDISNLLGEVRLKETPVLFILSVEEFSLDGKHS